MIRNFNSLCYNKLKQFMKVKKALIILIIALLLATVTAVVLIFTLPKK